MNQILQLVLNAPLEITSTEQNVPLAQARHQTAQLATQFRVFAVLAAQDTILIATRANSARALLMELAPSVIHAPLAITSMELNVRHAQVKLQAVPLATHFQVSVVLAVPDTILIIATFASSAKVLLN